MGVKKISSIFVIAMLITSSVSWTTFASTTTQNNSNTNTEKRYIVKFKNNNINANDVVSKYSGKLKHQFKHVGAAVADIKPENISKLQKDPNVAYIEQDNVVKAASTTLTNWGVNDIKAPASWNSGLTGKGVKVAVIDTGIASHPDLTIAGGANVINGSSTTSYADDNGHGTHVAGIIGGKGLNGGVKGVAPDTSIYSVKALDSSGSGYTSDIIAGIDWAIANKMDIISMSLGSNESNTALQNAVDTAYNDGILVVAAAGNDGNSSGTGNNIEYPANYSSVIAVGAVDSTNTRDYFSSTGSKLEVSAPGNNILSTYLNGGYAQMSGTSMATPFVAGDLALLKQKYPSYTNVQLRQLLDNNALDLGVQGRDTLYGFGLVQAPNGGAIVSTPSISIPTSSIQGGTYSTSQTVTLSDSTSGVSIYYTLDGTTPTINSTLYTNPIVINSTKTLKAIAVDNNGNISGVLSNTYIINSITSIVIPTPSASIESGTYKIPLYVRLYNNYSKPLMGYYTLDGSNPTTQSTPYMGYINITSSCTLKVIAADSYGNTSGVLTKQYNIIKPPSVPRLSKNGGIYNTPQTVTLSCPTSGVSIYYTLDGSIPTSKSKLYTSPIVINNSTILKAVAIDSSGNLSSVISELYIILGKLPRSGLRLF